MYKTILSIFIIIVITHTLSLKQTTLQVVQVEPVALDIIKSDFQQVLVFIYDKQQEQKIELFQKLVEEINKTFPGQKTLFAITNSSKDQSNKLKQYGSPGIKLLTQAMNYSLDTNDMINLKKFYSDLTRAPLSIMSQQQLKQIESQNQFLLLKYSNRTQLQQFIKIYRKIYHQLRSFNLHAYAIQTQIASIQFNHNNRKNSIYLNEFNDTLSLLEFISQERFPIVSQLNDQTSLRIFGTHLDKQVLLVYREEFKNTQEYKTIHKQFQKAALFNIEQQLKSERVIFAEVNEQFIKQNFQEGLVELKSAFQIIMTKVDYSNFQILRFVYNKENYTSEQIIQFINDVRMKRLNPQLKSQQIPNNQGNIIKKIVGKTFLSQIYEKKDQSIAVLFIDSKDPTKYEQSLVQIQKFVSKYKDIFSGKVSFGVFDLAKNQHQLLTIRTAPQLVLFQRTNKKKAKSFKGKITIEHLKNWINYEIKDISIPENYGEKILPLGGGQL